MNSSTVRSTEKLYSPRLLGLSAALADFPFDSTHALAAEARSRTCGSSIKLGLDLDQAGAVTRIGMQVTACAVGQSSAAIMAGAIRSKNVDDLKRATVQIEAWLSGEGSLPDWPDFDALGAARDHPGRHGALQLPWKAALEALSSGSASGSMVST